MKNALFKSVCERSKWWPPKLWIFWAGGLHLCLALRRILSIFFSRGPDSEGTARPPEVRLQRSRDPLLYSKPLQLLKEIEAKERRRRTTSARLLAAMADRIAAE
jgi:hypothetical protein